MSNKFEESMNAILESWTVSELKAMMEDGTITLPSFQRSFVWKPKVQRALLTSWYRGYPISPIMLMPSDSDPFKYLLLDGQQRLTTILRFVSGMCSKEVKMETKHGSLSMMEISNERPKLYKKLLASTPIPCCIYRTDTSSRNTPMSQAAYFLACQNSVPLTTAEKHLAESTNYLSIKVKEKITPETTKALSLICKKDGENALNVLYYAYIMRENRDNDRPSCEGLSSKASLKQKLEVYKEESDVLEDYISSLFRAAKTIGKALDEPSNLKKMNAVVLLHVVSYNPKAKVTELIRFLESKSNRITGVYAKQVKELIKRVKAEYPNLTTCFNSS